MKTAYTVNRILWAIIIALIVYGFLTASGALAMGTGTGRDNGCHTYNIGGIFGKADNTDAVFCGDVQNVTVDHRNTSNVPAVREVVIDTISPVQPVVSVPVDDQPTVTEDKTDKVKCNNGEGNGGEGCSPAQSEHANNDENSTTPKEDKSNK